MKIRSTRSQIAFYLKEELGMLDAKAFNNVQLCRILGLSNHGEVPSTKQAFILLTEFIFSDFFDRWKIKTKLKKAKERKTKHSDSFYQSVEWKRLRYQVLLAANGSCECCGVTSKSGAILHVDHIKPRSLYPNLALEFSNMQVLCEMCNMGKSNLNDKDWRQNPYSTYNINNFLQSI